MPDSESHVVHELSYCSGYSLTAVMHAFYYACMAALA